MRSQLFLVTTENGSESHPQRHLAVLSEHGNIKHQPSEQLLHHRGAQMPAEGEQT